MFVIALQRLLVHFSGISIDSRLSGI